MTMTTTTTTTTTTSNTTLPTSSYESRIFNPDSVTFGEIQEAFYQHVLFKTQQMMSNLYRPSKHSDDEKSEKKTNWWQFLPNRSSPLASQVVTYEPMLNQSYGSEDDMEMYGTGMPLVMEEEEEAEVVKASNETVYILGGEELEAEARTRLQKLRHYAQQEMVLHRRPATPVYSTDRMVITTTVVEAAEQQEQQEQQPSPSTPLQPGELSGPKCLDTPLCMRLYLTLLFESLRRRSCPSLFALRNSQNNVAAVDVPMVRYWWKSSGATTYAKARASRYTSSYGTPPYGSVAMVRESSALDLSE